MRARSCPEMDAAVAAALAVPLDASRRPAVVTFVAAATAVAFVVLGTARDRAVTVNDQSAGTRRHAVEGNGRLRRRTEFMRYRSTAFGSRFAASTFRSHAPETMNANATTRATAETYNPATWSATSNAAPTNWIR